MKTIHVEKTESDSIRKFFSKRTLQSHKGDFGKVLLIAGSRGMSGACALATMSALRTGSGLVKAAAPSDVASVLAILVPEAISIRRKDVFKSVDEYDAVGIGPGLSTGKKTIKLVKSLLESYSGNIVMDADALNAVSADSKLKELVRRKGERIVITPHLGETGRLLGKKSLKGIDRRLIAEALFRQYGCVSVLKGHESLVAYEDKLYINTTGNPGMATAGSGDVLTGIITSLLGQGLRPLDAARAGVYVHGFAGDLACKQKGEYGMTARDIVRMVPESIKLITES